MRRRTFATVICLGLCLAAAVGSAEQSSRHWLPLRPHASALFRDGEARARIRDAVLGGVGYERTQRLPDGRLQITQTRSYDRALLLESAKSAPLPEPWTIESRVELSPGLRLLRAETRLHVKRSGLSVFGADERDELAPFLRWDRLLITASRDGSRLTRSTFRAGKLTQHSEHDYPTDAVPIEIVGTVLSVAVAQHLTAFELDVLLPDGTTHGVRARVHHTRDPSHFARRYAIDTRPLRAAGQLTIIDMALSSPWKRLLFPYHFYFVYSSVEPTKLLAVWGGDPDDHFQAIREL